MCVHFSAWVAVVGLHHSGPRATALHPLQDMETMPHRAPLPQRAAVSRVMEDTAMGGKAMVGQATATAMATATTTEAISSSSISISTMATTTTLLEINSDIHMALANK